MPIGQGDVGTSASPSERTPLLSGDTKSAQDGIGQARGRGEVQNDHDTVPGVSTPAAESAGHLRATGEHRHIEGLEDGTATGNEASDSCTDERRDPSAAFILSLV